MRNSGEAIPVTVLEAGPNTVVQLKSESGADGYTAVQLGFGQRREALFNKPELGHFKKAGTEPTRYLAESRLTAEEAEGLELGQVIKVDLFEVGQRVDACGTSKGRGFTGVVKRPRLQDQEAYARDPRSFSTPRFHRRWRLAGSRLQRNEAAGSAWQCPHDGAESGSGSCR